MHQQQAEHATRQLIATIAFHVEKGSLIWHCSSIDSRFFAHAPVRNS